MATQTAKQKAAEAGAKLPSDHQEPDIPFHTRENAELFVPIDQVPVEDGLELVVQLQGLASADDADLDIKEIAGIFRSIRESNLIADKEGYAKFAVMSNAGRAIELIMAYVHELGKGVSS